MTGAEVSAEGSIPVLINYPIQVNTTFLNPAGLHDTKQHM